MPEVEVRQVNMIRGLEQDDLSQMNSSFLFLSMKLWIISLCLGFGVGWGFGCFRAGTSFGDKQSQNLWDCCFDQSLFLRGTLILLV